MRFPSLPLRRGPSSRFALGVWVLLALLIAPSIGCNTFGNARKVQELQSENDRLLAEFRAQRDRAESLEQTNRLQAERLAESEKLLARLTQTPGGGRLSSLPPRRDGDPSNDATLSPRAQSGRNPPAGGGPQGTDPELASGASPWQPRVPPAR